MLLLHLVTLSKIEWAEIFLGHLCQRGISQNVLFSQQGAGMAWAEGRKANLCPSIIFD